MSEVKVPKGYKQTEVGIIPEDWEEVSIDDISTKVGSGKTPRGGSSIYTNSGRPFLRSQNIGWGKLKLADIVYIPEIIHETFLGTEIKEHDVLLNITGASIGRCAKAERIISGGNVNQHVCIIRTDKTKLNPKLLVELINSHLVQSQIDSYQAGGNREGLNFSQIRQLKLPVPFLPTEQTAIANALTDTDNLIQSLEKLNAKKEAIKTGTMQQLLTGKMRLPEFATREDGSAKGFKQTELGKIPEDWEVFDFGEVIDNTQLGGNYANSTKPKGYPLIKMGNLGRGKINLRKQEYIVGEAQDKDLLNYSDLLFNTRNTLELVGKVAIWKNELAVAYFNSNLMRITFLKSAISCNFFMNYVMNSKYFIEKLSEIAIGTTSVAAIYSKDLFRIKISLPSKPEQTAIATILSDMDAEIEALQDRLEKTKAIKQGMMQQLLTGKVRLV